jgi:tRNA(Ile)-lysidine synthase TilS/MesJ
MPKVYFPNEIGKHKIEAMLEQIKRDGKDKPYDCIIGLSGGLDSSYLTYLCHTRGLRVLVVHIDDGFDTEISRQNIKKLCNEAHVELRTVTPNTEQFNALTLAYMKAGLANLDIPQDNTLFGFLYDTFKQEKVGYLLSGSNFSTESILQKGVIFDCKDLTNLQAIHSRFGTQKIDKLKFVSQLQWQKLIKL